MRYKIKDDQVVAVEVRDGVIQKRASWLTDLLYNGTIRYCKSGEVALCTEDKFKEKFEVMP